MTDIQKRIAEIVSVLTSPYAYEQDREWAKTIQELTAREAKLQEQNTKLVKALEFVAAIADMSLVNNDKAHEYAESLITIRDAIRKN